MPLPLELLVDVALGSVIDVPVEPTTGALCATGAPLGTVLPVEVLGGWLTLNGITPGNYWRGCSPRGKQSLQCRF